MFDIACYIDGDNNDSDNQWAHVVGHFLPRRIYTFSGGSCKPFKTATRILRASEIDAPLVLVSPSTSQLHPGRESLADFLHPDECCYLFGPDHLNMNLDREPEHAVFVSYPGDLEMFSWVAAAVVLYDRTVKRG